VYAIKLLSAMLDANAAFGEPMQQHGLVEYIVELWNVDHTVRARARAHACAHIR
jgi:hypothetical protein